MADVEEKAIRYYERALKEIPADHPDYAGHLHNLGVGFGVRFQRNGQMADLEQAIPYLQQALGATPAEHPGHAKSLASLGAGFGDRFQKTGQLADIVQAIQYYEQAVSVTPAASPYRATYVSNLGAGLLDRFDRTGQMADLDQGIQYLQQAVGAPPIDHADFAGCLSNLGNGLSRRFRRTDKLADLDQAIQYIQQAVGATPADRPRYADYLYSLGVCFGDRFRRTNQMSDLSLATRYHELAAGAVPADHPDRAQHLNTFGAGCHDRFKRIGEIGDLEQAIEYYEQALGATSADHPERARCLSNLGAGFQDRFERNGQMADVDQAIQYLQQALEATPADNPDRARRLNGLGAGFGHRFQRTSLMGDLDQAIQYLQQAVEATPADHARHAGYLFSLGTGLQHRFQVQGIGEMADLEKAIKCYTQALGATPADLPDRARVLNGLGLGFKGQFQRTGQMGDLDRAIQYLRQAVQATPGDHPERARYLSSLASGFEDRFRSTRAVIDLINSTEILKEVLSYSFGAPRIRILAGKSAVYQTLKGGQWDDAAHTIEGILRLFPEVTPRANSRDDLQYILRQLSGLASLSASVFLKVGKPALKALQALESGRGIIASLMIDVRFDASILKEKYPELWSRYARCQEQIATTRPESSFLSQTTFQEDYARGRRRHQLFQTLEDLMKEIRKHPGFERFLLPPTEKEIRGLAKNGPIVCFNVSNVSSEAFLITTTSIQVLPLPDLKSENVHRLVRVSASRGNPARRDAALCESHKDEQTFTPDMSTELQSLWNNAVKLVLEQLGLLGRKKAPDTLPRIFWVGGGIMALVPLHAAGYHTSGSTENTLSHAISSYVPSLKALQYVQNKSSFSLSERRSEFLVVSMPTTPGGHAPLKVSEEVAAIKDHVRSWASPTVLEQPSKESVLNALKFCSIAHFACHGRADGREPAKSALILGREIEEMLTLEDLDAVIHDGAQIAYLSACSTAEIKVQELADEGIHLASTFQLAGFKHVIGTLWGADDNAAVEVASKFYKGLLQQNKDDDTSVAQALHAAVLSCRNANGICRDVSKWAPFVHLGC